MGKQHAWRAHLAGVACVIALWVISYNLWYGTNLTWFIGPLILTWPTYRWPRIIVSAFLPPKAPEGVEVAYSVDRPWEQIPRKREPNMQDVLDREAGVEPWRPKGNLP